VLGSNLIACITLGLEACHLGGIGYHLETGIFGFAFLFIDGALMARYFYFVPFFGGTMVIYFHYITFT
jgi:hypothetical protein